MAGDFLLASHVRQPKQCQNRFVSHFFCRDFTNFQLIRVQRAKTHVRPHILDWIGDDGLPGRRMLLFMAFVATFHHFQSGVPCHDMALAWMVTIYSCHLSITLFANCLGRNFQNFLLFCHPLNGRMRWDGMETLSWTWGRQLWLTLLVMMAEESVS